MHSDHALENYFPSMTEVMKHLVLYFPCRDFYKWSNVRINIIILGQTSIRWSRDALCGVFRIKDVKLYPSKSFSVMVPENSFSYLLCFNEE